MYCYNLLLDCALSEKITRLQLATNTIKRVKGVCNECNESRIPTFHSSRNAIILFYKLKHIFYFITVLPENNVTTSTTWIMDTFPNGKH